MPPIRVVIHADKLTASVLLEPGAAGGPDCREAVIALLGDRGVIASTIDEAALDGLIAEAKADPTSSHESIVAKGSPARHGIDSAIEFAPGVLSEPPSERAKRLKLAEDAAPPPPPPGDTQTDAQADGQPEATDNADEEETRVDHYARSAYAVVKKGDVLGSIRKPTAGEDGADVLGGVLRAKDGKPLQFKTDDTIEINETTGEIVANSPGHVVFTGSLLRVSDELVVEASVDFSTGHIAFPGHVVVTKGVRDHFIVRAGKNIVINDLVEAATIESGRSCLLNRGMAAREKGTITTGRDLEAKYLDAVSATVGRDLRVQREVNDCTISIGRNLDSPQAAILGGQITIAGGGDIAQLGSETDTATTISLGRLPGIEEPVEEAAQLLPQLTKQAEQAQTKLDEIGSSLGTSSHAADELTTLHFSMGTLKAKIAPLRQKLEQTIELLAEHIQPQLRINRIMYAGVIIIIGPHRCEIAESVKGPITVQLDGAGRPVFVDERTGSTTHITTIARVTAEPGGLDLPGIKRMLAA